MYQLEVIDLTTLPPATDVLSVAEQAFYGRIKVPKRKTEWFGGRLALKKLLCARLGGAPADYTVLAPGGIGKPAITKNGLEPCIASPLEGEGGRRPDEGEITTRAGQPPLHIPFSITHSNGFAVAALATGGQYIGIDLEKNTPRMSAWKDDFFHPSELAVCPADASSDEFLTTLWTQKEALVKLLGSGLTVNSRDVRVVGGTPHFWGRAREIYTALGAPQIRLETRSLLPGFCFSVAVGKRPSCTG